jgi:hypothetical protein
VPTAYVIDSSGAFYGQPFFDSNWQGPIVFAGRVYYCMEHDTTSGGGQAYVGVYRSDQAYPGAITSFTAQDTASAPRISRANVFYPKTGGSLIYISVYNVAGGGTGQLALYTFDMNTNTYASIATGGPIPQQGAHRVCHRANGDWVIAYDVFGGGARDVYWTKWNAGWSAGVLVSTERGAGQDAFTVQVGVNGTDDVIIYREIFDNGTNRYNYTYSVLSTAGALTAVRTLLSNQRRDLNQGVSGGPYYITSNDTWMFPFCAFNSFTDDNVNIAKSTPSANPTSDSIETVATADNTVDLPGARVTMNPSETTAYCEWNIPDQNQLAYATQAVGGTTWSGATILFDSDTDPLVPSPGFSPILVQRPSITVTSLGEVLWSFGTFGPDEPGHSTVCDIQYFGQTGSTPPVVKKWLPQYIKPNNQAA